MDQRYRVFLNEKVIRISEIINTGEAASAQTVIKYRDQEHLRDTFLNFRTDNNACLVIVAGTDFKKAVSDFESMFIIMEAAGGIVFNHRHEILFIKRFGKWDFPKGKREVNESMEACALREVAEETGLRNMKITGELPSTRHLYPDSSKRMILKKTSWFKMQYEGYETPVPQEEEGIEQVVWADENEAARMINNSYASLRELFRSVTG